MAIASSAIPFTLAVSDDNANTCESHRATYAKHGTFKEWKSSRLRVHVSYASKDTLRINYAKIGFNRESKRSTEVVNCVLSKGDAALRFFSSFGLDDATSGDGSVSSVSRDNPFGGNTIWCIAEDWSGEVLSCNGVRCTIGEWEALRAPQNQASRSSVTTAAQTPGGWGCGNGCTIYYLLGGGFAFECSSGSDFPQSGGGGPLPSDFTCTPTTVAFNQTVTCTLVISDYAIADDQFVWKFTGFGDINSGVEVQDTTTQMSWSGKAVIGGTVTVSAMLNGQLYAKEAQFDVGRRSGSAWKPSPFVALDAAPGELDETNCLSDEVWGAVASSNCGSIGGSTFFTRATVKDDEGFTAAQVPDAGPNASLWYVASQSLGVDLRAQIKKRLRDDDTQKHPVSFAATGNLLLVCTQDTMPKTVYHQNALCEGTPFFRFIDAVWEHEHRHTTFSLAKLQEESHDVPKKWEPLARKTKDNLVVDAKSVFNSTNIRLALLNTIHIDNSPVSYSPALSFYDWLNGDWRYVVKYSL